MVKTLHTSQNGNCFICGKPIDLELQANTIDVDHIEPIRAGGKDGPGNFGLTHDSCNRSKQSSDLRVARVLASFDAIAESVASENRSPNLGDVLANHGGSQYNLPVKIADGLLKTTFAEIGQNDVLTFPICDDQISGSSQRSSIFPSSTSTTTTTSTLVVRQRWIDGYRDFSLMRASWVVKRQSTRMPSRLR